MTVKHEQLSFDDLLFDNYEIKKDKKIRLITTFSGYDSQALSLKYLGVDFEHYKTCEWNVDSIQALYDLHFSNDKTDYSKDLSDEEVTNELLRLGISNDNNNPMSEKQVKKFKIQKRRNIYNQIKASHDLVNIMNVKGDDLEITDTDNYEYIFTYSFPCQDLSNAGKKAGGKMGDEQLRKNIHPTVKPIELMQYLVRLVTPKNGTIMDCFMGSGSTGKATMFENRERNANYKFIGIEMTDEYLPICKARIDYAINKYEYDLKKEQKEKEEKTGQLSLF